MTDAERWREIAEELAASPPGDGLCTFEKSGRMKVAMHLFEPEVEVGRYWWGCPQDDCDCSGVNDNAARILAACFLAAMADADGGNHV